MDAFSLPPPHHLKIDVDGSELNVLRGAAATLAGRQLRTILIEVDDPNAEAVSELLGGHGFELRSRHPRGTAGLANLVYEKRSTSTSAATRDAVRPSATGRRNERTKA